MSQTVSLITNYISFYEPTYFIVGTYPAVEFQFSIKSQLFAPEHVSMWPLNRLYFAYTQTSFWDLFSSSPSFYDTSYKPSSFFCFEDVLNKRNDEWFQLDLQGGIEHESNGRGGVDERAMNTVYFQPTASFYFPHGWKASLTPRAWFYPFGTSQNNGDIRKYHGYADLLAKLSWDPTQGEKPLERYELATMFHIGDQGNNGSVKVDLSFSVQRWIAFTPRIHAQFFVGDEQTLRQYNQFSTGYRIGISLFD